MPRVFWFLFAAMLAAWLSMNLGTVPKIEELSGGLRLLDMRFTGYSVDEARSFVAAIGDEGAALYLGAQHRLDTVFPPLLGAVLFLFYRWLFPGFPGLIIGMVSLTYVAADILENLAVVAMLRAGADGLTPEMAATASQCLGLQATGARNHDPNGNKASHALTIKPDRSDQAPHHQYLTHAPAGHAMRASRPLLEKGVARTACRTKRYRYQWFGRFQTSMFGVMATPPGLEPGT